MEDSMNNNLHTFNKLKNDIKVASRFSILLPKDQRMKIKETEKKLTELEDLILQFNSCFTELGWCAYDSMSLPLMKEAITAYKTCGADAGERVLVKYYKEDVKEIIHWLKNKAEPFDQRYDLIQHAFDDHFAGRYYASVPLFLMIADGAVNDYTKSKGFFAEGIDVTAWDCLVGCSDSLTRIKNIFNKSRKRTNHDEIRLPYRNGILHGRDLNYGNEYVSCKCVALMFSLADWMSLRDSEEERKAKFEKESNPPPIPELMKKHKDTALQIEEISKWRPRKVIVGKDIPFTPVIEDCVDYQYVIPVIEAFNAWKAKNYHALSIYLNKLYRCGKTQKKRAGECRKMFASKDFCSFELIEIEERACSMSRILVQAAWEANGKNFSEPLEFGCLYQDEGEQPALPWRGNGEWTLIPWNIQGLYKE